MVADSKSHIVPAAAGNSANAVATFIRDGITSGRFAAGDRLPTERALATILALPRTAVRRGLAKLEAQGRITRHVGRGTFVVQNSSTASATALGFATSPAEIMEVRLMVEPQIAVLAASSATTSEFEHMQHCLDGAESARSYDDFETWDGAFHRAIAVATHNEFLVRIFNVLNAVRDEPLWGSLKRRSFTAARRRDYERDHRRIGDALQQRDGELARRLMREHIMRVRANLLDRPE